MSDTMTEPKAGWYPDPSSQAPYRWWDGHRWSPRTRIDEPEAERETEPEREAERETGSAHGNPLEHVHAIDGSSARALPSRRSLREGASAHLPAVPASAISAAVPASPIDLGAAYVPLNPLGGRASIGSPSTPDWRTPESWIANSPSGHHFDHAVYATGAPFVSAVAPTPTAAAVNPLANLGAGFALIGLLYQGVIAVWGANAATSWAGLAVAAALIAGMILAVAALARSRRFTNAAGRPRRAGAVLVLLVAVAALGAQGSIADPALVAPLHLPAEPAAPAAHAAPSAGPHAAPHAAPHTAPQH